MKKFLLVLAVFAPALTFSQSNQELTNEDKLYGLSLLWSNAKFYFANFKVSKINWDSAYKAFIPKVTVANTVKAYYDSITKFYALLKDGHSNVFYPDSIDNKLNSPSMETRLIDNKIIIVDIYNDTLKTQKIDIGDEIIQINGVDAVEYGRKYVMPYQSASTMQDILVRSYEYRLLLGNASENVKLRIKKENGKIMDVVVSRKTINKKKWVPYSFRVTNENIGILTIKSFEIRRYDHLFDSIYPALLKTKALIIDVRDNGGGNTEQGSYVMSHLIDKPTYESQWKTQQFTAANVSWGIGPGWYVQDADEVEPTKGPKYMNPVVVLTSARTFSSAEDFVVEFDNSKRGIKIGQATGGSTGNPYFFTLPGGGSARICSKHDYYPDGKEFVGVGIKPDIEVDETIDAIQSGTDLVLNKAIEYLNQKMK